MTQELQSFIKNNLIGDPNSPDIDENEPLFEKGILDSMGLMQLISFIEERNLLRIPDDEVTRDNFETLASIERLVKRLKTQGV